jgi:hypothetical protein
MHPHSRQNLSTLGGVPRRRLLQGVGALGLAAILRPTSVFAEPDDEGEGLGSFGPWSTPVNLGPVVNTPFDDNHPAISKNGLSLYITSNRPGGVNGKSFTGFAEIWVSQRTSPSADWGPPVNLDALNSVPVVNSIKNNTGVPAFSADGHLLFFNSDRPGGLGGNDLYVSRRTNKHDDFGWQEPVNLGVINSPQEETAPTYFEDEETGMISLYLASNRPGGLVGAQANIWVSTLGDDGSFGPAVLVPELSSPYRDTRTAIRRDGLEFFLTSNWRERHLGFDPRQHSRSLVEAGQPWSDGELSRQGNWRPGAVLGRHDALLLLRPPWRLWGPRPLRRHPHQARRAQAGQRIRSPTLVRR